MVRSNYCSLAKASLVAKGPCLETGQGFISESLAIAEYLDAIQPERLLLPTDPFARAKCLELIRHLELGTL